MTQDFNPKDFVVTVFKAAGSGGFSRTVDKAVRVLHVPSGIYVDKIENRSVHMNRAEAFAELLELIKEPKQLELFQLEMQPVLVYNTYIESEKA